jgi:hypothetical protein
MGLALDVSTGSRTGTAKPFIALFERRGTILLLFETTEFLKHFKLKKTNMKGVF